MNPFYFGDTCFICLNSNPEDHIRIVCRENILRLCISEDVFILCSCWMKSLGRCRILG